jgi:serine/threonine protein kinase/Tol biopolymer transport system component
LRYDCAVIGETISHYTVLGTLGRGGMGVVYKAEDHRLKRQVALKFLSDDKPFDHQALERFRWEAQAASALNHPNICTIYDIDEAGGRPFIAMELLEGRSLRDIIVDDGAMPVEQVVEIGIQIADALSTAHGSGIIHRDLKPANVFMTSRHQAKLLDFGLAKAVAHRAASVASELALAETGSPIFQTNPGFAVGTAGYMAPEQIRDDEVDARTDVFALGIVLYELATGRPAFPGRTLGIVQDAVLNRAPQSPSEINPDIPPKLEEVIARCLEKDPDLRYQTAADLRGDLKRVLRDQSTQMMSVASGDTSWRRTPTPAQAAPAQAKSWSVRRHALLWLAVAAAGAIIWFALERRQTASGPTLRVTPFTTLGGQLKQPVFSPEGNQIAFVWNGGAGDSFSLYTQLIDAGAPLRLTTSPGEDISPAWSPDSRFIAFLRRTPTSAHYFIVPALGGVERPLRQSFGVPFSYGPSIGWSPDGGTLAIADRERAGAPLNILLVDVQSGAVRALLESPMPYLQNPTFTADGRTLAFVAGRGFLAQDIYAVPAAGGTPRRITTDTSHIAGIAWTPDEREIVFSSNRGGLFSVWKVAASGGEPQLVTAGEDAYSPTVSRRSGHLAYMRLRVDWNLWRLPGPRSPAGTSPPERLILSTREEWQPAYSPDDRHIAFVSSRSGSQEIWVAASDGTGAVQVTTFRGPPTGTPRWSPDGTRLVLDSRVGGDSELFTVHRDGSGLTRLTHEPSEDVVPSWSRDGRFIYFSSDRGGRQQLWKVPAGGGAAVRVLDEPAREAAESADGRWLYFWRQRAIWRVPLAGGAATRVTDHPAWGNWVLRDDVIYLLNEDAKPRPTIDAVSTTTGERTVFVELDDWSHVWSFPPAFDLSHDGAWFVFGRVDQMQNDVMLIQNFMRP